MNLAQVYRTRDAGDKMLTRWMEIRSEDISVNNGVIVMTASTNARVAFGDYGEVLSHDENAVDATTCRALLLNHDPNQIVGNITETRFANGECIIRAEISASAKLKTGMTVREAVKCGALRGVSIGYNYDSERDASYDEGTRTITVRKWRLLECTLTPIPRDPSGTVRDLSHFKRSAAPTNKNQENTMDPKVLAALYRSFPNYVDFISGRIAAGVADAQVLKTEVEAHDTAEKARIAAETAAKDEGARARAMQAEREKMKRDLEIIAIADSHGLRGLDYTSDPKLDSLDKALARMLEDKAKIANGDRALPTVGAREGVTVTTAAEDKFRDAAVDALICRADPLIKRDDGQRGLYSKLEKPLGMRNNGSLLNIARSCMVAIGIRDAMSLPNETVAQWIADQPKISRFDTARTRAANQAYGQFPGILSNFMDKTTALGFTGYEGITYPMWTRPRMVNDFKPFISAALTLGDLALTTENVAFPELNAVDMNYQSALGLWGGTLTLTYQALVSDDLGEFFRNLGMAGAIAQRTVDRTVYQYLLAGPGTNGVYGGSTGWNLATLTNVDNMTGQALGTAGNLDNVRNAFRKKLSPTGRLMGNTPAFLLHPIPLARVADEATGRAQPLGEPAYLASNKARQLQPIEVNYLDDPSLQGNSSLAYYLVGDSTVDTMVVATLAGMQTPQVLEFDPGATGDRKFKIMYAFVPVLPTYTDGTAIATNGASANIANRPIGITRGTG